ncbi:MAG TPA: ABC transporter permease subunit [Candidatus Aquicultor sp.]|jgi:ABC-type transport system involved in multi-copper enzyme maturation permease subunit
MLTIASLTFKEALRKKILLAGVILTLLFLLVYGVGLHYVTLGLQEQAKNFGGRADGLNANVMVEQSKRMLFILGIYFSSSIVSVLAVFSAVGSVSSEVENGMLHAILAKPIARRSIIIGKFIGYALMLIVYSLLLFTSVLLLNKYLTGVDIPNSLTAIGLFTLQPLILLAVTMMGSTRLSTLANGITAFMVYMIGVIGGMVEQIGALIQNSSLIHAGVVTSLVIPVDAMYRKLVVALFGSSSNPLEAFSFGPFGAASEPSSAMVVYVFIYILGLLGVAAYAFRRRDIG